MALVRVSSGPAWDLSTLIDRPVGFVERGWKTMVRGGGGSGLP